MQISMNATANFCCHLRRSRLRFYTLGPLLLLLVSLMPTGLQAQIYADVSVSSGSSPLGTFRILLEHQKAPRTVANFIGLATGQRNWLNPRTGAVQVGNPFYDGLIFHRLIHNFMIQGGDPLGTGTGGPGYVFQDEFDTTLSHSGSYIVSMANSGANSNGSQFFITLSAPTNLDQKHSIFGVVIDDATYPTSRALIDSFKDPNTFPTNASNLPDTPITITSVAVSGPDLAAFDLEAPGHRLPYVTGKTISLSHDSSLSTSSLNWDAKAFFDYPLYYSSDLQSWSKAGAILSLEDNLSYAVGITALATTPTSFYTVSEIDYREVPKAPQNMLSSGNMLTLHLNGGNLILTFNGIGGGSWQFIYDDTAIPNETGTISSSNYPNTPTTGSYINYSGTHAPFLSLRLLTVELAPPAGPDLLTNIEPLLSFHSDGAGWFDGNGWSDGAGYPTTPAPVTFKGEFSYTEGP